MSSKQSSNQGGNANASSFPGGDTVFGNRIFSLSEVEALRRMTVQQQQQQQQRETQQQAEGQANNPQIGRPAHPFVVLTQVPVQATPFARLAQGSSQQQQSHSGGTAPPSAGQGVSASNFDMEDDSWAQFLQPTPLAPDHHHPGKPAELPRPEQQSSSIPQQASQQVSQKPTVQKEAPFNPSTVNFLQQLMMNAASAALQQQQSQVPGGNNFLGMGQQQFPQAQPQYSMNNTSMPQPFVGRMQVDSPINPVPRPDTTANHSSMTAQGWKQMWDSGSKPMFPQQHQLLQQPVAVQANTFSAQPSKRKFDDMDHEESESSFGLDGFGDDNDFMDIAPTPLSEIRLREQAESMQKEQQTPQVTSSSNSQSQKWPAPQLAQQGAQPPAQQIEAKGGSKPAGVAPKQMFILPSTMMPPTVLASTFPEQAAKSTHRKRKGKSKSLRQESPQHTLERIVEERGYGKVRITSEEAGYDAVPSPLQLASFGTAVVKAVHTSDPKRLGELLSCGLSPNPCNQFRDSIVDLVCKRASEDIFNCLVEHGSELRVCDGFGRTPLHHCCWASNFSENIAEAIMQRDLLQLFIEDKRGQTPLEYVRPSLAESWVEFLEEHKEKLFPLGGSVPSLQNVKEDRPEGTLPDPRNSVSVSLASAVSSGKMTPEHVREMDENEKAQYQ